MSTLLTESDWGTILVRHWVDEHGRRKRAVYDDYKRAQLEERKRKIVVAQGPEVAAHRVRRAGDIFKLQKILGHHSIQMTMRYAHLAPFVAYFDRFGTQVPVGPVAPVIALNAP